MNPNDPTSGQAVIDGEGSRWRNSVLPAIVLSAILLVTLARALGVDLVDDTYIFLRYARNIAEGHGPVFNICERVEGFSSPLWTFLLAGVGVVIPNFEAVAYGLGLACGAGVIALLLRFAARGRSNLGWLDAIVLGLGLASCPMLVFWSASGMDAPLFLLLITASLLSLLGDKERGSVSSRTIVLLVVATLTRMEAVLLAGYVGLIFWRQRRTIRALSVYGIVVAAAILVRYSYYGDIVPNTYHAKVTFDFQRRLADGARYLLPAVRANGWLLAVTAAVLLVAWRKRVHHKVPIVLLSGWIILWTAYVLYVGGDNFSLFRFALPILPAVFLLLAGGWAAIRLTLPPPLRYAALAAAALAFTVSNVRTYHTGARGYYGDMSLVQSWEAVGRWLERETDPDTVIATIVPGALGYFSHRPTIDMLGLTDRNVSVDGFVFERGGHGHARYHTDYIYDRNPDLIVYHSSGRFEKPKYADPERIPLDSGYALYHFVTDPRCEKRYNYTTARLDNGTLIEMLERKPPATTTLTRGL